MHGIALAGHLCVDLAPAFERPAALAPGRLHEVGPMRISLGGCVANTGRALAALGARARVNAAVGDDELGRIAQRMLAALPGIEGSPETAAAAATSYSVVLESAGQDRTFWHHVGANAAFDGTTIDLDGADILHLGYPSLLPALLEDDGAALVALLERARRRGVTTSVDLAVVDPATAIAGLDWDRLFDRILPLIDVLTPSADDLTSALGMPSLTEPDDLAELAEKLVGRGAGVVAVSAGAAGLFIRTGSADRLLAGGRALECVASEWADRRLRVPSALSTAPVTTNGAGDASTAGFLYALAACSGLEHAAALATACAAAVLSGRDATPEAVLAASPELSALFPHDDARPVPPVGRADHPPLAPVVVPANQPADRFYAGGERIARFRRTTASADHTPEDWVGSVTAVRGQEPLGLTRLPAGELLADAVRADPVGWLGEQHVARWGADTKLLVKLLDAGERLPVHAHPESGFARAHLGVAHGKAEAWHILSPGRVHLGLRRDLARDELERLVARQENETLLALLHEVPVEAGDRVFVPPGTLHAIGAGVFLAEVQEPEDLSILLEWRGFPLDGEREGHLGLGFPLALDAVDRSALTEEALTGLVRRSPDGSGRLPQAADPYFRLQRTEVRGTRSLDPGFAVLIVVEGRVSTRHGDWPAGTTVLLPAAAGRLELAGEATVLVARPPAP